MSPAHPTSAARAGLVTAVLTFGGIVVSLTQTLIVPSVSELPNASDAAWAVTATLLAAAVALPVTGRLGDLYGKRRMLLACLALLVAGSVTAALGDSLAPLITGRALQGLAAGVVPLGIGLLRDTLPTGRLGSALMSASLGAGGALGPAVAEHLDRGALFWTCAALGAVAGVLVALCVPESTLRPGGRFDLLGTAGLATGLVCLLLAVSKGADWGWRSGTTLGLFAAAIVVLVGWGFLELHVQEPLVDLRTTARRQVLVTHLASPALGFSAFAILPQLLRLPEATDYGLVVAPAALVMLATAAVSTAWSPKTTLMTGAALTAAGSALSIVLMSEVWHLALVSAVIGAGVGLAYGAMPALITEEVGPSGTAAAHGLNTLMRSLGTAVAGAVAGVILTRTDGFSELMAVAAGAAALAFLIAAFLPGRRAVADRPVTGADAQAVGAAVAVPLARAVAELVATVPGLADGGPAGGGHPVRGHVRGAEQAPVAGASVTLISLGGRQLGRAVTGTDGAYAVEAPGEGTYVMITAADGHQPQASTVVVGATPMTYEVLLSGSCGLAGTVRAADGGGPVAGAVVVVTDVRGDVLATVRTDGLGEFALTELVPGPVTLAVSSPKHRPLALPVEIGATGITRVAVELRPGARIRGTVRGSGAPLSAARVTLVDAAGNVVATTTTGSDGAYAFADLDEGPYTVIATGYPPRATGVTLTGGDLDDHDIALAHTAE